MTTLHGYLGNKKSHPYTKYVKLWGLTGLTTRYARHYKVWSSIPGPTNRLCIWGKRI